jgi:DNA-directed RNA polymerase specialized sigma24 family protein
MAEDEITPWLRRLSAGDPRAAEVIWREYFARLVRFARRKLEGSPRRAGDEEDVALSAMKSFCLGMAEQRFEKVEDRHDLWRLLLTITARKACAQRRRDRAAKRGGGATRGESALARRADAEEEGGIGEVLGSTPTPELAVMVADTCRAFLDRLEDDSLRDVARLALEGCSVPEIAERLGCVRRTVERKLQRIRDKCAREDFL